MSKMSKSEVYSWRLTPELKVRLEAAARDENTSIGTVLERLAREWLESRIHADEDAAGRQRRLHERARRAMGTVSIDVPSATNEEVRKAMGELLEAKYRRSQRRAPRRTD